MHARTETETESESDGVLMIRLLMYQRHTGSGGRGLGGKQTMCWCLLVVYTHQPTGYLTPPPHSRQDSSDL